MLYGTFCRYPGRARRPCERCQSLRDTYSGRRVLIRALVWQRAGYLTAHSAARIGNTKALPTIDLLRRMTLMAANYQGRERMTHDPCKDVPPEQS